MQQGNDSNKLAEARKAEARLGEIKFLLKIARVSYDEAREMSEATLQKLKVGMVVISRIYSYRHRKVSFLEFIK